jgi:hypothetical protein
MMEQQQMKQYCAQKELRNCGFTPESINAIQSTTIITRDGMQHVVPTSQNHLNETAQQEQTIVQMEGTNAILQSLQQQFQDQQKMFSRFKHFSDQRIMQLEQHLGKTMEQLKDMCETVKTLKSNAGAAQNAANFANRTDAKPMSSAIDRNRVAPSEVQVEDIFYSGNRR